MGKIHNHHRNDDNNNSRIVSDELFHQRNKERSKYLIEGYSREAKYGRSTHRKRGSKLFNRNIRIRIPAEIVDLCVAYYYTIKDRFDPILHGQKLRISNSMITETKLVHHQYFYPM